jgi:hypothetical protein
MARTPGYRFAPARPDTLARLSVPKSSGAGPARSVRPPPLPLMPLARLSVLVRSRARLRPQI